MLENGDRPTRAEFERRYEAMPDGLWLDAPALLPGDPAGVLAVLQQGIAGPERRSLVAQLQAP